jgi:hypothetical protein
MSQIPQYQSSPGRGTGVGTSGMAIASMVLGIVSLVFFCVWYLAIPAAILAIVLGLLARAQLMPGQGGKGFATAGIICGFVAMFIAIVIVAGLVSLVHFATPALQKAQQQMQQQLQQQQQRQNGAATSPAAMVRLLRLMF